MLNSSGLKPLGHAVLVMPYEPEKVGSLIELPSFVQERGASLETRAIVIEVGEAAWPDEKTPRAKPGDRVLIARMAGSVAKGTRDGKLYRFVNARDIYAAIVDEDGVDSVAKQVAAAAGEV
jgi:co-chaperonin GroES (HSP10)